jgi:hypothetical protein
MARTNLSVDGAVYDEFALQARRQNKTLFALTNESLSAICRICNEGGNVSELYPLWRMVSVLKQVDAMTLPSSFLEEMIVNEYEVDKEKLLQMFRNLGTGLVGMFKLVAENLDDLALLTKDFMLLLPIKNFKVSKGRDGLVEVGIVGAGRRLETTECSTEFVKSVLNGYGFEITKQELGPGTIRLWARQRGLS